MNRRGFLTGLFAAPAIVPVASLMPVKSVVDWLVKAPESLLEPASHGLLTPDMITRQAIRLFINTNAFLKNIDTEYDIGSA